WDRLFLLPPASFRIETRERPEANMSDRTVQGLNRVRKFLRAVAGVAALVSPVVIETMIGIGHSPTIWAQTPAPKSPEFGAASIKPLPCVGSRCGGGAFGTERLQFTPIRVSNPPGGITARGIILEPYHLAMYQPPR